MYSITEVDSSQLSREFLELPVRLYKNEDNWIRPLNRDIESVFDPKTNKLFRNGELIRWIAKDSKGQTVGRLSAFIDKKSAFKNTQPTGGIGFFECIDNQEVASLLFDTAKQWLTERGMEAMDGPVNFGDRDRWWGLLVDGFEPPNYCVPYNFPYYQHLFEDYGFRNYYNQLTYHRKVSHEGISQEIYEKANRILKNPDYTIEHVTKRESKRYANDFSVIFNKGWAKFAGVAPISPKHAEALLKSLFPIMDERLILYMYYKNEPAAFFITLPDINPVIGKLNGKFNTWSKLKFAFLLKTTRLNKMVGLIFGVVPEHQAKGLESAIIMKFAEIAWSKNFPYTEMEMNWIGDFNPPMMKMLEQIGASVKKTHVTYRYLFDRTKEFHRAEIVNKRVRPNHD